MIPSFNGYTCILWSCKNVIQLKFLRKNNFKGDNELLFKIIENSDLGSKAFNCQIWSLYTVHND